MYLLLLSLALAGEQKPPSFKATNIVFRENGGLSIKADKAKWNLKAKSGELSGGVVVTQDKLEITSDSLKLSLDGDNKITSLIASTKVKIVHGLQTATATSAYWNLDKNELKLEGDPKLVSPDGIFSGGTIFYWPEKEEIQCSVGCTLTLFKKE